MTTCPTPEKYPIPTRNEAQRRLSRLKKRTHRDGNLRVYACECGYFHLGRHTKDRKRLQQKRARLA